MSRENKFKAWDEHLKQFSKPFCIDELYSNEDHQVVTFDDFIIADCEIVEYTGLKDAKGQDIYEGDILQIDDPEDGSMATVVFENGAFMKHYFKADTPFNSSLYDPILERWWVVVGNVHENPELLEA